MIKNGSMVRISENLDETEARFTLPYAMVKMKGTVQEVERVSVEDFVTIGGLYICYW